MRKLKLVYGVGVNDSPTPISIRLSDSYTWKCPFYQRWTDVLRRCYSQKHLEKYPTYVGCTVATEWHLFSTFKAWMKEQEWEGKEIDKDILFHKNKVYGPNTCVFIPNALNLFLLDHAAGRGEFPIGVNFDKNTGKFRSQCKNPFTKKTENLGLYTDPETAHKVWCVRKHELACEYADLQDDQRIAESLRNRYLIYIG